MSDSSIVEQHLIAVRVSELAVAALCCSGREDRCKILHIDGLPPDSQFLSAHYEPEYRQFFCVFEHPSFPHHREGTVIEVREIWITLLGEE